MIRRCVTRNEAVRILRQCHNSPSRGHHGIATTARKVFEARFYWPDIFRNAQIKRWRQEKASQFLSTLSYLTSDGVRTLTTVTERSRLKRNPRIFGEAMASETLRRRHDFFFYIYPQFLGFLGNNVVPLRSDTIRLVQTDAHSMDFGKECACVYFNFPFAIKLATGLNVFLRDPSPHRRILLPVSLLNSFHQEGLQNSAMTS
ncbi:hypothetical protein Tco_1085223 [Tanacetum coccineum]